MPPEGLFSLFILTTILAILVIIYQIRLYNAKQELKMWRGDYDYLNTWSKISKIPKQVKAKNADSRRFTKSVEFGTLVAICLIPLKKASSIYGLTMKVVQIEIRSLSQFTRTSVVHIKKIVKGYVFFVNWKRIIYHMLEFYKRSWQILFPLFGAFVLGAIQTYIFLKDYHYQIQVTITLLILAVICLIIGIIAYCFDFKDARHKDHSHNDLRCFHLLLSEMNRLLDDNKQTQKVPILEQEIAEFLNDAFPSAIIYWNQPLIYYATISDRIKRRIAMLENIIRDYENLSA